MALAFNNNHLIYHQMDVQWSMGLAGTNFGNPDLFNKYLEFMTRIKHARH